MSRRVALDTSYVIGLLDDRDIWHAPSLEVQAGLRAAGFQLYVFDCVVSEVASTLARRVHEKRRTAELASLLDQLKTRFPARRITWVYPDLPALYDDVLALVETSGGALGFNDALIALSCRMRRIPYLASFDADFDQVDGLIRLSRQADVPLA